MNDWHGSGPSGGEYYDEDCHMYSSDTCWKHEHCHMDGEYCTPNYHYPSGPSGGDNYYHDDCYQYGTSNECWNQAHCHWDGHV